MQSFAKSSTKLSFNKVLVDLADLVMICLCGAELWDFSWEEQVFMEGSLWSSRLFHF